MRKITVLIASALINASAIPGLAAESTLNKDVNVGSGPLGDCTQQTR